MAGTECTSSPWPKEAESSPDLYTPALNSISQKN